MYIREPYMWVQIGFNRVKDYFQIFPEDKAKISFWKGYGDYDPESVTISPFMDVENVCEPDRVADEIICENFYVWCTDPDDRINLRIAAAGEILLFGGYPAQEVLGWENGQFPDQTGDGLSDGYISNRCGDVVAGAFDYNTMSDNLVNDPETFAANQRETYYYNVPVYDTEEGAASNAWFTFMYDTYYRSNEKICFAGDN